MRKAWLGPRWSTMTGDRAAIALDTRRSRRPYLFLDVDGCLNSSSRAASLGGFADTERADIALPNWGTAVVWTSREMGRRICGLAREAEIIWLTTWFSRADEILAPLMGLPRRLEHLEWSDRTSLSGSNNDDRAGWKQRAPQQRIETDPRPFIWADDAAIDELCSDETTAGSGRPVWTYPRCLFHRTARSD